MTTATDLPSEPVSEYDPRWAYAELTVEQAFAAWPCAECGIRRGEHVDQRKTHDFPGDRFPGLDITDHDFKEPE